MKGEGIYELYRREEEAAEQRRKPQPAQTGLRLEVTGGGGGTEQIVAEGTDWGEFGAPRGDDRVFILRRADRKLCSAANAD